MTQKEKSTLDSHIQELYIYEGIREQCDDDLMLFLVDNGYSWADFNNATTHIIAEGDTKKIQWLFNLMRIRHEAHGQVLAIKRIRNNMLEARGEHVPELYRG